VHIHFGSNFGFENVFPRLVNGSNRYKHGHLYLGQKGLLELMELHLGLKTKDIKDAIRISSYKKAIHKAIEENGRLYIKDSYEVDDWGTSKHLLKWRDELQIGLWNFDCSDPQLERLYALSEIEKHTNNLPLGVNDRWRYVLDEIRRWKYKWPIYKITVYETKEYIHPFFKALFEVLSKKKIEIQWYECQYSFHDNDLSAFQKKLSSQSKLDKVKLKNDGSLYVLKGENEKVIADALGEFTLSNRGVVPLYVISSRGQILEDAFINRGFPACGYSSTLEDSAFDQLLILITVFLWKPLDPERLIQYLTLPNAPIDKKLRLALAKIYANKTSIHNDDWHKTIEGHADKHQNSIKKLQKKIDYWFDRKTYDPAKGAPSKQIVFLFQDLKSWADKYKVQLINQSSFDIESENTKKYEGIVEVIDERIAPLKKLSNQCKSFIDLINSETKGDDLIEPIKLNKWLNSLDEDSYSTFNKIEKGALEYVMHPANITSNTEELIYWNFIDPGNPISNHTDWTDEEKLVLKDTHIHQSANIINQWFSHMSNAILKTRKKLILCIPSKSLGESIDPHPLYNDLVATFDSIDPITIDVNLNYKKLNIGDQSITLKLYTKSELPKSKIAWYFQPSDMITSEKLIKREAESYTSLSKLFYYPHAYFLNYQLGIKPIDIPEVSITPLLKGNIAHRTAEELWKIEDILSCDEVTLLQTIETQLDKIIESEGAVFLLPKNKVNLMEFGRTVKQSLLHLTQSIKNNGWSILEAEQKHLVQNHIPLLGLIDLVLVRGENEIAIVDLKWGGLTKRKKELLDEQELQLIIYDQLMKDKYAEIHLHYYIITSQEFVSRTDQAFKDAIVIGTDLAENLHRKALWDKMVNTYRERWKQIESGHIEVGIDMYTNVISNIFELWNDKEKFLSMPLKSNKKEADRYSNYKNLIGQ